MRLLSAAIVFLALSLAALSQPSASKLPTALSGNEASAVRYFDSIRTQSLLLRGFLYQMPKGGDLHNHLSGAVYAESYIEWAAESGLCVEMKSFSFAAPKAVTATADSTPNHEKGGAVKCDSASQRPATDSLADPALYRDLVDALSMRNFPVATGPGEYHFFETFVKFFAVSDARVGESLAELAHRAALQNEHYLELTVGMDGGWPWAVAAEVEKQQSQNPQSLKGQSWFGDLSGYREQLLKAGLRDGLEKRKQWLDAAEATMRQRLGCATTHADPGCKVTIRYIYQVLRAFRPEQVFAQTLFGFEMAQMEPRIVGINFVQPEDWLVPVRDFDLHMRMLDYLHHEYPKLRISLHAGELAFGQVMPEVMGRHIRKSIEVGHAERIGHGVDVMYDPDAAGLLRNMAQKKIAVEIALTSNDVILGIRGNRHPLRRYIKAGVPVVIATDDEGVSRSDVTNEYQRAVEDQGLSYAELKRASRNSLEYSFLVGASLWADYASLRFNAACANDRATSDAISITCARFIAASDKASEEWKLEKRFVEFEAGYSRR